MEPLYKNGFEFKIGNDEAMIWESRCGTMGWVYVVMVGWSKLRVMAEGEIYDIIGD